MTKSAIAVEKSENRKIGRASATYASQESCPRTCPFYGNGCFGEHGPGGIVFRRLTNSGQRETQKIARAEARAIDSLTGELPLRLHVVGDCKTNAAARIVSGAARRYQLRHGSAVWTYTHGWKDVRRASWGRVSVLASCQSTQEAKDAMEAGYAAAMVVASFPGKAAYVQDGVKVLPCPAQTREGVTCSSCRLCWDDSRLLRAGIVIGFEAHGTGAPKVRLALPMV